MLLAACATVPQGSGPASVDRAERLLRAGNAAGAAELYEQLAIANPPPEKFDYLLAATGAWLAANRADDAQRVLDLATAGLTPQQDFERALLAADVAVARGQYAPAWQQISRVPEPQRAPDAYRLFQVQQQVALRAGQPLEAVRAGISRERVATGESERTQARRDLLSDLRAAIERGLRIDPATSRDAIVRGWLELAEIAATAGRSPLGADASIARWRSRYPAHPASTIAGSEILGPAGRLNAGGQIPSASSPVALLLPMTGSYAATAGLIRDGFMAAIERLPASERPAIRVYDTGTTPVESILRTASADGAGFVVGPLTREDAQVAATTHAAGVPILLLNALARDTYAGPAVFQYALSPEDEARQIARQITRSGGRGALVLSPGGDWGRRVTAAFAEELTADGGHVIAEGLYDIARNDVPATITAVLGIDDGRRRHGEIEQVTRSNLQFIPQPRPDIDAIFVAGWQAQALPLINALLRNFNAGQIPTYITRSGLGTDARTNRDLLDMRVLDMPWTLDTVGQVADLRNATQASWSTSAESDSRYFAFGFDAATLALRLRRGGNMAWPLEGLTGRINLTPEGRFELSFNWARLGQDGQLRPYDPAQP